MMYKRFSFRDGISIPHVSAVARLVAAWKTNPNFSILFLLRPSMSRKELLYCLRRQILQLVQYKDRSDGEVIMFPFVVLGDETQAAAAKAQ